MSTLKNDIRRLIEKDDIEQALNILGKKIVDNNVLDQITLISSRLQQIKKEKLKGLVDQNQAAIKRNQLNLCLLEIISDLNTEIDQTDLNKAGISTNFVNPNQFIQLMYQKKFPLDTTISLLDIFLAIGNQLLSPGVLVTNLHILLKEKLSSPIIKIIFDQEQVQQVTVIPFKKEYNGFKIFLQRSHQLFNKRKVNATFLDNYKKIKIKRDKSPYKLKDEFMAQKVYNWLSIRNEVRSELILMDIIEEKKTFFQLTPRGIDVLKFLKFSLS